MRFIIIPEKLMTRSLKKWLFSEWKNSRKVLFSWTLYYHNSHKTLLSILIWLYNSFILVPCIFHRTYFIYLPHILQKEPREKLFKAMLLKNQTWNHIGIYLSLIYFSSLSIKENIDELIYEAFHTIRGKKHKIPNELSICNYSNENTEKEKDIIENCIRYLLQNWKLRNKSKNEVSSYFKSTQLILQF